MLKASITTAMNEGGRGERGRHCGMYRGTYRGTLFVIFSFHVMIFIETQPNDMHVAFSHIASIICLQIIF